MKLPTYDSCYHAAVTRLLVRPGTPPATPATHHAWAV